MKIKEEITEKTQSLIKDLFNTEVEIELEVPPKVELGDFAFPCFEIAKEIGEDPNSIAQKIKNNFPSLNFIKEVKATGPYLNFIIKREKFFNKIIGDVLRKETDFFSPKLEKEKVMIEFISPNSNKPLHIGHLRNACLGDSNAKILKECNKDVTKACLINDKGVPVFKSILAWMKWHSNETPQKNNIKPDHFLGNLYVEYEKKKEDNPELKEEVQELVQRWEKEDKEIVEKFKNTNQLFLEGFKESIQKLGFDFDLIQFESEVYEEGKKIIKKGLEDNIFKKEKGKIVALLPEEKFGKDKDGKVKKALLLREDGTSVYLTQDVGLAVKRFKEYDLDRLLYVVGSEQKSHFKRLFTVLEQLGYKWSENCTHIPYGLVDLPQGSMSSRKGNVVKLDDLIKKVKDLAREEIEKRYDLKKGELEERAEKIMNAAIKFYLLRVNSSKNIQFDPKASISFEGSTGPYCQYAYARTQSILKKAEIELDYDKIDFSYLGNKEEILLLRKIMELPQKIETAGKEYNPSFVANSVYNIAKDFSVFYNKHSVLFAEDEKTKKARLALTKATSEAIQKGLALLGIDVLKEM